MKSHHKAFDYTLYKQNDMRGKQTVINIINNNDIDTNVVELPETPHKPKPDLMGDLFYHEVAVATTQWVDSNILPNNMYIPERKIKMLSYSPILFWIVCNDLNNSIYLSDDELYKCSIKESKSNKTKAGFERWIIISKENWRLIK